MTFAETEGPFGVPVPESQVEGQLLHDELSLFDATAVAVSSVAPAYSIAATLSLVFIIAGIGVRSPAMMIISFVPVMFIAMSYFHLNRRNPNCGASYSWVSQVMHPTVGWFNGWVQIATSVLFCMTAPLLAGGYTLQFLHSALHTVSQSSITDPKYVAIVGAMWLLLVTFIVIYGIRWTTNFQWVLVVIEYVCVIGFSVGGIVKVAVSHPVHSSNFHMAWLNPFSIGSWHAVAAGLALGVFFFWGWDTALNLNEESKQSTHIPGRAGIIAMWLLLFVFVLNFISAQMLLSPHEINAQGPEILFYFGQQFAGSWASYVMIFAVLTSTVATTQTTLLPAARITYSMARDGVFPKVFATVHEKFKTPALGTAILSLISLFGIMLTAFSSSINTLLANLYSNIGVLVAAYYAVTGLACAWAFRKTWGHGLRANLTMIVAPLLGGLALVFTCYQVIVSGGRNSIPDIVVLGVGAPILAVVYLTSKGKTSFFSQARVAYTEIED
jgi:amino acid transporter